LWVGGGMGVGIGMATLKVYAVRCLPARALLV